MNILPCRIKFPAIPKLHRANLATRHLAESSGMERWSNAAILPADLQITDH